MLHVVINIHVTWNKCIDIMHLHAQEHHMTLGVSAWFRSIYVSVDFGKSAPCLVSINCRGDMVRSTLVGVDGGLSGIGYRPNRGHDFKEIEKCPVLK